MRSASPTTLDRASSTRAASVWIVRAAECAGAAIGAVALWHTLLDLWLPLDYYDEGILVTNANLLLHGEAPYRDFYSNYPPGIFLVIAGLWKVFGVSALLYRCLGLLVHMMVAALAGHLAGRIAGRRFIVLAAGLTLAWIEELKASPSAYLTAVLCALLFIELALRAVEAQRSRTRWLAAGLALGAVSCFRHDLFVYLALPLSVIGFCGLWKKRGFTARDAGWTALGAALPIAAVWIPTFARAGWHAVAADLYFDQVNYVLPARVLPMPSLVAATHVPALDVFLPRFAARELAGGILLAFLGPIAGCIALLRARAPRLPVALVTALALAVAPHMLGRTDLQHTLYTVTPAILLLCGFAYGLASRSAPAASEWRALSRTVPLVLLSVWLAFVARENLFPIRPASFAAPPADTFPRCAPLHAEHLEERRAALAFVAEHTGPDDPIYVGLWSHRRALGNDLDLYFLADRVGATRYLQFDPNVVTRPEVQQEMIAELEAKKPKVGILTKLEIWYEPNLSNELGAPLLDEYIHAKYRVFRTVDTYRLIVRK